MPGPYDYTINIPQPPAQNFLQSLLGIQQLKGLQQQSEIAAQQQAFAAQQQPLQLEAERARIAQAKAGTSATETSQQAAQYQLDQRKALDAELLGLSSDPSKFTPDNLQKLAIKFHSVDPTLLVRVGEMRKSLPDQAKTFGDNIAKNLVLTSVTGDSEAAIKQLDKELEAAKNTPGLQDFVPRIEQLKDNFIKYPDQTVGLAAVGQTLFAPDQGKAITDVMSEQAKIEKTKAETKKELALATETKQQKQVDEEKRALDLEKERLQIQEIQQKIDAGRSDKVKIYASQNKEGYKLNEEARNATLQAEKARGILDKIDSGEVKLPTGTGASIGQWIKDKVPFLANDITFLRTQYQGLLAPEAKKMLPPGSASDADMKAAREGLLNKNATPQQFRKAVDVIAKISEDQAKYADARLGWISENEGSIGTAVKDISVFGSTVKKGTPLNAWWNKVGKDLDLNKLPTESAPAPVYAPPAGITIKSVR